MSTVGSTSASCIWWTAVFRPVRVLEVRNPRRAGTVEPRPGRDHRRRRPCLSTDRGQGGAQALEGALVLTELLRDRDDVDCGAR